MLAFSQCLPHALYSSVSYSNGVCFEKFFLCFHFFVALLRNVYVFRVLGCSCFLFRYVRDLVHLEKIGVGGNEETSACKRRFVWGMLTADDAGIVSKSAEVFAEMISPFHRLRSSRYCGIGKQDGDEAATNTEPDNPGFTPRHRSTRPQV